MSIDRNQMFGNSVSEMKRVEDDFGIAIITEKVPLPSEGAFYPAGHPLHGVDSVEIRAMTAKDENILFNPAYVKDGSVIDKLIESCLVTKYPVDQMLIGDRNAIMVAIRMVGYSPEYQTRLTCPNCRKVHDNVVFNLGELEYKECKAEPEDKERMLFAFTLPGLKRKVIFRLMTVKDEKDILEIEKKAEAMKRKGINTADNNKVTNSMQFQIVGVEGPNGAIIDDGGKIRRFIEFIPATEARALRAYMKDCQPDVDMGQNFDCDACGFAGRVEMPIGAEFFWPDIRN